jgi:hypothetical protein
MISKLHYALAGRSLRGQAYTNMRLLVCAHANDTLPLRSPAGGADPNATSYDGITALMYAVQLSVLN